MKKSRWHEDPPRWRDARPPFSSFDQQRLSTEVRALPAPRDLDETRLAEIRRDVLAAEVGAAAGLTVARYRPRMWLRMALFALVFLALGSLATTLVARTLLFRSPRIGGPQIEPLERPPQAARGKTRRWRMTTRDSAEIEVRVAPEGAEIAVVDGDAELSGPDVVAPVTLSRGESWREGGAARPAAEAPLLPSVEQPHGATAVPRGAQAGESVEKRTASASAARSHSAQARVSPAVANAAPPRSPVGSGDGVPTASTARARVSTTGSPPAFVAPASPPGSAQASAQLWAPALEPPPLVPLPTPPRNARTPNTERTKLLALAAPRVPGPTLVADAAAEAYLVTAALRTLRIDGLPTEALAKLDEHGRRFPSGVLAREASLARVEALLKLGRRRAALAVLDGLALTAQGADRSALLARGELRADGERCSDARRDFDQLLDAVATDGAAERALHARARCSARAQDWTAARADLHLLKQHFPDGTRHADVESLLRQLSSP